MWANYQPTLTKALCVRYRTFHMQTNITFSPLFYDPDFFLKIYYYPDSESLVEQLSSYRYPFTFLPFPYSLDSILVFF